MDKTEKKAVFPEWFESHPLTQKIKAERDAEILSRRTQAKNEIDRLQKEADGHIPKLREVVTDIEKKHLQAKDQLKVLQDRLSEARMDLSRESIRISREIGQQETVLIDTYDPRIDGAIQFFMNKFDEFRRPGKIDKIGRADQRNLINMTKVTTTETNVDAIKSALLYCLDAIKELERMKLSPALDIQKIQELKDGIPSIEVYQEYTGRKPFGRGVPSFMPDEYKADKLFSKLGIKRT